MIIQASETDACKLANIAEQQWHALPENSRISKYDLAGWASFKVRSLTDQEMAQRFGAVQGSLF
jgi:hypothetical protein